MLLKVSSEIHLLPNWTIFVQLGIFLTASAVMYFMMVRPIIRILNTRKIYTVESEANAETLQMEADALNCERIERLECALRDAHVERGQRIERIGIEAEKIKIDAKIDARLLIDDTEISIDSSERSIFDEMNFQVEHLADEIVEKVSS
ncbi:MAG: hypothetical protein HN337_03300 [Deltaproteobacteria bacterium]|nr:hypothetical protein [Deltaproteobacteria bacterium]